MRTTVVVLTTIRVPEALEGYCYNANFYRQHIKMLVVGDKKTPQQARAFCHQLSSTYPILVQYLGIEEQEQALKAYPKLLEIVPYNSACRKLLGMLIAYLQGFDNIITIDDDNFATSHNFVGCHSIVGTEVELSLVESPSGWFNTCEYLIEEHNLPFYYRGFPWSQRRVEKSLVTLYHSKARVVVNSGFWLGDPDIDAIAWLSWPIRVIGMHSEVEPNFGLYPGTWCPFNNQNTVMAREVLPAYFTPHNAGRFSDVWPAYIVCRIAQHLGHIISYGFPFACSVRNPHNYWQDLDQEKVGAQATEPLIGLLRSVTLTKNSYHDCLGELIDHLNTQIDVIKRCPSNQQDMLMDFIRSLEVWHEVFNSVQGIYENDR